MQPTPTAKLNDILKPGQPLPPDALMISTALDILDHSPHGQQLVDFARINNLEIRIMATPQPTTYLPESRRVYIGFNRAHPISPPSFILMLAGALREAQQEFAGIKNPGIKASLEEHQKTALAKQEDKLWYICTVACELSSQDTFSEYYFLDELRKMGHDEVLELYLKQEKRK